MRKNKLLVARMRKSPNQTLRLPGLRTILLGQLERNHRTRNYGYESGDLVQSDVSRTRPQFRTLVQRAG